MTNPPPADADLMGCPFCGGRDAFVERADYSSAYVVCNDCSARGPVACQESDEEETPGEASARFMWQRRTPSPVADEALVERLCEIYEQATGDKPKSAGIFQVARAALQHLQPVDGLERVRERCARVGYITCAETRHVSLGRKVEEAILQLDVRPETEG